MIENTMLSLATVVGTTWGVTQAIKNRFGLKGVPTEIIGLVLAMGSTVAYWLSGVATIDGAMKTVERVAADGMVMVDKSGVPLEAAVADSSNPIAWVMVGFASLFAWTATAGGHMVGKKVATNGHGK